MRDQTLDFLNRLHAGGSWAYLWTVRGKRSAWYPIGKTPPTHGQNDVYFGVHPTSEIPPTNAQGEPTAPDKVRAQKLYIAAVNCLFAELDAHTHEDGKRALLADIAELKPQPSVIIDSGGGYHCYWLLDETFVIRTADDRARIETAQAAWVAYTGGDDGAKDIARVLRLPGTQNTKYAPPRPVTFVSYSVNYTYSLSDLEARAQAFAKQPPTPQTPYTPNTRDLSNYVAAALTAECQAVASARTGTRNSRLNTAAYSLGQLVAAPWTHLDQALVESELIRAAIACGLPEREALATLNSGLSAGMLAPREQPEDRHSNGSDRRAAVAVDQEEPPEQEPGPVESTQDQGRQRYIKSEEYIKVLAGLGYTFRMNECNDRVECNDAPMSDALRAHLRSQLRDLGYPRVNVAEDAWIARAYVNSYHPIREYLHGLTWDGKDHIASLARHIEDKHAVFPVYLLRWLIGSCAKVYQAEQNRMLVLDGKQNLGKSHFVRWLLPASVGREYLVEAPIQPDNKDDLLRLIGAWIWEVAELGSTTRKADREALKYFLTMRQVTVRAPYGHYDLVKPAMASFIGTVNNESGILSDPTGNRRFMVCKILHIDWGYAQSVDVDGVWAQAMHLYRNGEPWELTAQEAAEAAEINAEYEVVDVLEEFFDKAFVTTGVRSDFVETTEILNRLHGAGWTGEKNQRTEAMELSKLMTKLEIDRATVRVNGRQARGYVGIKAREEQVLQP
jgi:hypothetical protein